MPFSVFAPLRDLDFPFRDWCSAPSVISLSTQGGNLPAVASVTVLLVGLTGGIGSGKSTVADLLRAKGAVIVDADEVARVVVEPGEPAFEALVDRFGTGILDAHGRLDRSALAAQAFADDDGRKALGDITWPAIGEEFERQIRVAPPDAIVVCDIPLLVESKAAAARPYKSVIVVEAPIDLRLARLEQRGVPRDDAERRMAAQATDDERREVATHLVDNGADLEHLARQVDAIWDELEVLRDRAPAVEAGAEAVPE